MASTRGVATFQTVGRMIFGNGAVGQLSREVGRLGDRVMIVSGQSAVASGLVPTIEEELTRQGLTVTCFSQVRGEPDLDVVQRGIDLLRASQSRVIVGIGGGSALDAAKAIAGLAPQSGSVTELFYADAFPSKPIPWVAVATTAGSGADVTHPAVLIDRDQGIKRSIRDERWFAKVAIVDPELTRSNPPSVTAHSGMDALTQAIESHVSLGANLLTTPMSQEATVLIGQCLEKAFHDGGDLESREKVMMGATMAGMALAVARLGLVHGMAHEIGMACQAPHGLVCATLLPMVMEWNMEDARARTRYGALSRALGLQEDGDSLLSFIRQLNERLGIPDRLGKLGLKPEHFPRVVDEALRSGSTKANPRAVTAEDVTALLKRHL